MKLPLLLALLLAGIGVSASAQPYGSPAPPTGALTCVVCAKSPLVGKYFVHNRTNTVCADCATLETSCALCRLPVKNVTSKTSDGRIFCRFDAPNVVVAQDDANKLFAQARSELSTLSDGALTLRSAEVAVQLVDVDYWNAKPGGNITNTMHRLGFSISRLIGGGYTHNVVLMSGQLRSTTLSTCAHEFAHLWLNENLKAGRSLDPDTREALCELFAYRLAAHRGDTNELTRIKQNTYTKGVVLSAIEFDAREGLPGVLSWVRTGTEPSLPDGSGVAPASPSPTLVRELRPPPPPPVKLELRSLLRTSKRTVAFINTERFEVGREISMFINGKRHLVRLESAHGGEVVVSVDGVQQTLQLQTP